MISLDLQTFQKIKAFASSLGAAIKKSSKEKFTWELHYGSDVYLQIDSF